ncbi:hypothetical protein H1R20_g56, partial [Candolleomyces eurysporus]
MQAPDLPPTGQYLQCIRESAGSICQHSGISIEDKNIERLLLSEAFKSSFNKLSALTGVALPLKFASPLDELNLLSVLALLNFGSSFDVPLRAQTGHGASNAIRALVFSMYITSNSSDGDFLSSKGIQSLSTAKVAELIGVNVHVEKPHSTIPGVTVGELGGPVYQYVQLVTHVLNETGRILLDSGYPNLGFLVAEALKEGERARSDRNEYAAVDLVIERLVRAIPAFRDMTLVDGEPVYIFSKVIFLLDVISHRFGSISPPPFPIPDLTNLPVSADGINSALLVHLGIVNISPATDLKTGWPVASDNAVQALLAQPGDKETETSLFQEPTTTRQQAFSLRAATVIACDRFPDIAKNVHDGSLPAVTVRKMNAWFQGIVKERPDYRSLGGIVLQDNIFF